MRVLTISTLFPNYAAKSYGIFVANRLRHLLATGEVQTQVIAPIPHFPLLGGVLRGEPKTSVVPLRSSWHGVPLHHPRFLAIPKFGMKRAPERLLSALLPLTRRIIADGFRPDVIDAHYVYPDGVAAARLGQLLGIPVVITARGTDLNVFPTYPAARDQILEAARSAAALVTVSEGLKQKLVELGIPPERVTVLRNGVDLGAFRHEGRATARQALELKGPVVLMVGNLVELKGHAIALRAVAALDDVHLLVVGSGPEESSLKRLARSLGIEHRVRFLGRIAHEELPNVYRAADQLLLCSSREGWPNVLLEAMACGTPVIATDIPGVREVVAAPAAGVLVKERTPEAFALAIAECLNQTPRPNDVRSYAEAFSWDSTTVGQLQIFRSILEGKGSPS